MVRKGAARKWEAQAVLKPRDGSSESRVSAHSQRGAGPLAGSSVEGDCDDPR